MKAIEIFLIVLFAIWVAGAMIIVNRHSEETLWSLLKLQAPRTTFLGWVYLVLWAAVMFFLMGLTAYLTGYRYH